jgi:hypothetical protein
MSWRVECTIANRVKYLLGESHIQVEKWNLSYIGIGKWNITSRVGKLLELSVS